MNNWQCNGRLNQRTWAGIGSGQYRYIAYNQAKLRAKSSKYTDEGHGQARRAADGTKGKHLERARARACAIPVHTPRVLFTAPGAGRVRGATASLARAPLVVLRRRRRPRRTRRADGGAATP
eukprot:3782960-Pleurochrysis_carterae.AAC.2